MTTPTADLLDEIAEELAQQTAAQLRTARATETIRNFVVGITALVVLAAVLLLIFGSAIFG